MADDAAATAQTGERWPPASTRSNEMCSPSSTSNSYSLPVEHPTTICEVRVLRRPRARARAGRTDGENLIPLNSDLSRPRKVGCARVWPYRRVERPRGVRSDVGSNVGGTCAPCERRGWCAKKSCATRDEVSVERASRENVFVCGTDSAGRGGSRQFDLHRRRAPRWISVGRNATVTVFDQSRAFLSTRNEFKNAPNASSFDRLPRAGGS